MKGKNIVAGRGSAKKQALVLIAVETEQLFSVVFVIFLISETHKSTGKSIKGINTEMALRVGHKIPTSESKGIRRFFHHTKHILTNQSQQPCRLSGLFNPSPIRWCQKDILPGN